MEPQQGPHCRHREAATGRGEISGRRQTDGELAGRLSPQELSYGTIGPSLRNFGKLRGNSEAIQRYTYAKIYNSRAYNVCSNMPRFGHSDILTEQQIKDVVALLLDPESPVNK